MAFSHNLLTTQEQGRTQKLAMELANEVKKENESPNPGAGRLINT